MLNKTVGKRFILCDHTKVGLDYNFHFGDYKEIDYLITDINADTKIISKIKEKYSIDIIEVEPLNIVE